METSIEPLVVSSLSFGSRRRTALSLPATLTSSASAVAMAPRARLSGDCGGLAGGGGRGGGSYAGSLGVSKSMLICHRIVTEGADLQLKAGHHQCHGGPGLYFLRYTQQREP